MSNMNVSQEGSNQYNIERPEQGREEINIREELKRLGHTEARAVDLSQINEKPIQFISADFRTQQFKINPEAISLLQQFEASSVSFACVAGKYRSGKSFLLNKLIGLSGRNGFKVDPSVTACTEGLWIWSRPIYQEAEKQYVFLLDTEGTESTGRSQDHDARVFALALLLSSVFIFNSTGSINEQSIQQLILTTTISKTIAVSEYGGGGANAKKKLSNYAPKFIWVLRDFMLQIVGKDGRSISSNEYLEQALLAVSLKKTFN